MTVVITVLAVLAAAIVPNLLSEQRSREARQFFARARNLMVEARSRSIGDGQTRSIRLDDSGGRLVVERIDQESGEATEDRGITLPDGVTGSAFRVLNEESTSAEWVVRFYADGKARGGAISFDTNGRIISLIVENTGQIRRVDDVLPATEDETWDAGGYEQRI